MFNEYGVYKMMKFRQEYIEQNVKEVWKQYELSLDHSTTASASHSKTSVNPCCQCSCASC